MKFIDKQLAIKLKEKGFKKRCFGEYRLSSDNFIPFLTNDNESFEELLQYSWFIPAPTIDQVLEWLREDCGLYISMSCSRNYDIDADGRALGSWVYWWYEIYAHLSADLIYQEEEKEYETYDEAILEGIEYVINNLI